MGDPLDGLATQIAPPTPPPAPDLNDLGALQVAPPTLARQQAPAAPKKAPEGNTGGAGGSWGPEETTIGPQVEQDRTELKLLKPGEQVRAGYDPLGGIREGIDKITEGIEAYNQQGRAEHPVLSRLGDVTREVKELLEGGQAAGKPLGTTSGLETNPVVQALAVAPEAAEFGAKAEEKIGEVAPKVGRYLARRGGQLLDAFGRPTEGVFPEVANAERGSIPVHVAKALDESGAVEVSPPTHSVVQTTTAPHEFLNTVGANDGGAMDFEQVDRYRHMIREGSEVAPSVIEYDEMGNVIGGDGRHQAMAHALEGTERMPVEVHRRLAPEVPTEEPRVDLGEVGEGVAANPVAESAQRFNASQGRPEIDHEAPPLNEERARALAAEMDSHEHEPNNPEVRESYNALIQEVKAQWNHAVDDLGIHLEPSEQDPYDSYEAVRDDVKNNNRLKIFTGGNELPADHPLAQVDPETGLTYNVMLRGVHDLFGHIAGDNNFSEAGEGGATHAHRQMFSDEAIPALLNETEGQVSQFFHGKNQGNFPPQNATVVPREFVDSGMPKTEGTPQRYTHYSSKPIEGGVISGERRGEAQAGAEGARLQHENKVPGVYAYREGAEAESQIRSRANKSTVVGDKKIADISGAQKEEFEKAYTEARDRYLAQGDNDTIAYQKGLNDAEAHLRDAGYDGYEHAQNRPGTVFLFGDQPIEGAEVEARAPEITAAELQKKLDRISGGSKESLTNAEFNQLQRFRADALIAKAKTLPEGAEREANLAEAKRLHDWADTRETGELPIPDKYKKYFNANFFENGVYTWPNIRGHEAGHAIVADAVGFNPGEMLSHLTKEGGERSGALTTQWIHWMQGSNPMRGRVDETGTAHFSITSTAERINDILATFAGGGVQQELMGGPPYAENPGIGGDLINMRHYLSAIGIEDADEQQAFMDRAEQKARNILTHPNADGIIEKHVATRAVNTLDHLHMTADQVAAMVKEHREARNGPDIQNKISEQPAGDAGRPNAVGQEPIAGREGQGTSDNGKAIEGIPARGEVNQPIREETAEVSHGETVTAGMPSIKTKPEPEEWHEKAAKMAAKASAGGINPATGLSDTKGVGTEFFPEVRQNLDHAPTAADFKQFESDNHDLLTQNRELRVGWDNNSKVEGGHELNIGAVGEKKNVMRVARKLEQRAPFDIEKQQEIEIGGEGIRTEFPNYSLADRLKDLRGEAYSDRKDFEYLSPDVYDHLEPDERNFIEGNKKLQTSIMNVYHKLVPSVAETTNAMQAGAALGGWWQRYMDVFHALGTKEAEDISNIIGPSHAEVLKQWHAAVSGNKSVEMADNLAWNSYADWLEQGKPLDRETIDAMVKKHGGISDSETEGLDTSKLFKLVNSPEMKGERPFSGDVFNEERPNPLMGKTEGSRKIPSMGATVAGPGNLNRLVIDTHMLDFYGQTSGGSVSKYLADSAHLRQAAKGLNLKPGEGQEQLWGTVLGLKALLKEGLTSEEAADKLDASVINNIGKDYAEIIQNDPEITGKGGILDRLAEKYGIGEGSASASEKISKILSARSAGEGGPRRGQTPVDSAQLAKTAERIKGTINEKIIKTPALDLQKELFGDEFQAPQQKKTKGAVDALSFLNMMKNSKTRESGEEGYSKVGAAALGATVAGAGAIAALSGSSDDENKAVAPQPRAMPVEQPEPEALDVHGLIHKSATQYGIPEKLLHVQAETESKFNQSAVSPKGARGVMQLMPNTAKSLNVDPDDMAQNIDGGARLMSQLHRRFGAYDKALAAYNWSPDKVQDSIDTYGPKWLDHVPYETHQYVLKIMRKSR